MQVRSIAPPLFAVLTLASLSACSDSSESTATVSAVTSSLAPLSATSQKCKTGSCAVLPQIPRAPTFSASTVPANGDVNPYGIAFIPSVFPSGGTVSADDLIVANFNNSANQQGTGTTVVRVDPKGGAPTVFYSQSTTPGLSGFSTALGAVAAGFVFLGNVPSLSTVEPGVCHDITDDTDVGPGALTIIDRFGNAVQTLTGALLDGPWDLTVVDNVTDALVFVSNVKSGTVTRINLTMDPTNGPVVTSQTKVASGFPHRCDAEAFVVGPTGLAFDSAANVLYVASTDDNAIFAVSGAGDTTTDLGKGKRLIQDNKHFHGPLGLVRASNGDLISAQGDAVNFDKSKPSQIVEVTQTGAFVSQFTVNHAPGSAFGVALTESAAGSRFAVVDDGSNMVHVWNF
jgi:hypothetical protein